MVSLVMTTKQREPSKTYTGTVSSKRQITIPAEAFRALHLQAGDKVTLTLDGGSLRVAPVPVDFNVLLDQFRLPPEASQNAAEELREQRGWIDEEDR